MTNHQESDYYVCMGKHCRENFSADTFKHCQKLVEKNKIKSVNPHHCIGNCEKGPNVIVITDHKAKIHNDMLPKNIDKQLKNK